MRQSRTRVGPDCNCSSISICVIDRDALLTGPWFRIMYNFDGDLLLDGEHIEAVQHELSNNRASDRILLHTGEVLDMIQHLVLASSP